MTNGIFLNRVILFQLFLYCYCKPHIFLTETNERGTTDDEALPATNENILNSTPSTSQAGRARQEFSRYSQSVSSSHTESVLLNDQGISLPVCTIAVLVDPNMKCN